MKGNKKAIPLGDSKPLVSMCTLYNLRGSRAVVVKGSKPELQIDEVLKWDRQGFLARPKVVYGFF